METRRSEPGGRWPRTLRGPGFSFLIFAILSAKLLESPEALLQSLRRQIPEGPIIAVMDRGEPDRIFQLLELGIQDFLVPPLRACDVLPASGGLRGRTAVRPSSRDSRRSSGFAT